MKLFDKATKTFPNNYRMTHVLTMPLATSKTRPQVQMFLDRLRNHESTAALPYPAWCTADSLGLLLGRVCLSGPDQLKALCEDLKKFNAPAILGTELGKGLPITLKGLHSGEPGVQRAFTNRLCADVTNAQPVTILKNELYNLFKSHGLPFGRSTREDVLKEDANRTFVVVMSTAFLLKSDEFRERPVSKPLHLRVPRYSVFDAREVYPAFEDTLLVENLPLEQICLRENGLKDIVKNGDVIGQSPGDIFRVSLSDPAESDYVENDPSLEYVKASTTQNSEQNKTPFLISSDPRAKETYAELYPMVRRFDEQV